MNANPEPTTDKSGESLTAQRFQMLEEIARELAGDIIFPTCFDAAFRLRKELQNADLPISRMGQHRWRRTPGRQQADAVGQFRPL
ncbi:MAG: hypothetical protein ACOYNV_03465 [Propionivibrio sp.]